MAEAKLRLSLAVMAALVAGCATSPWSAKEGAKPQPSAPATPPPAMATHAQAGPTAGPTPDAKAMQEVMNEVEKLGDLDPAAQKKLVADLKDTDVSLWPLVIDQFRAAVAYRRRAAERAAAPPERVATSAAPPALAANNIKFLPGSTAQAAAAAPALADSASTTVLQAGAPAAAPPCDAIATKTSAARVTGRRNAPRAGTPPAGDMKTPSMALTKPAAENRVQQVSYSASPNDVDGHLMAAIDTLEAQKGDGRNEADVAQQARLRMLYLLAGRRDDALRPMPSLPSAQQEYWNKQLFGLSTWLDAEHTPDRTRRVAQTKEALDEAVANLGAAAPLGVRNLAFCTAIQSFGSITPFKKNDFAPDQEVLLYAEVENFTAQSTPKGFHTALTSSYQILDGRGQRVTEHEFGPTDEYCQSRRHDFFIGYRFRMPKRIYGGKHTLQLTIVDTQSHKVGQSSLGFTVAEPRDER
jgi:hypothetical protein